MKNKDQLRWAMWYAAVQRHFPDKKLEELVQGYGRWKLQKVKSIDYVNEQSIEGLRSSHRLMDGLPDQGLLLSFHYGPYRLLAKKMLAAGYAIALLASAKILEREKLQYQLQLEQAGMDPQALLCLNANEPTVLKGILQAVKQENRIVLAFIDADEGYDYDEEEICESYLKLQLGSAPLYWRSNLFRLAHRFGVPLHIGYMASTEDEIENRLEVVSHDPQLYLNETDFLQGAVLKLENMLSEMMAMDWTAWENWTLLHRYQKNVETTKGLPVAVPTVMIPIFINKRPFLFHPGTVQFLQVLE